MANFISVAYKVIFILVIFFLGVLIGHWDFVRPALRNDFILFGMSTFIGAGIPAFLVWSLSLWRRLAEEKERFLDSLQKQYATAFEIFVYMYSLITHDTSEVELVKLPHMYEIRNLKEYDTEALLKLDSILRREGQDNHLLVSKIASDLYIKTLREHAIEIGDSLEEVKDPANRERLKEVITSLFLVSGAMLEIVRNYLDRQHEVNLPPMDKLAPWETYQTLLKDKDNEIKKFLTRNMVK
ncbi:hypothetical protein AAIR98_001166 [Elusimicrobium simillimum]|uniref:hypothetical protein n=1 Tax=Elusimicrobium simillimum TaxID=3143438 RepID=UPI003C6EB976